MSRDIGSANVTAVDASHVHEVVLVAMEWDDPGYVHSDFGTISYDGNDYLGVGDLGAITDARESEQLGPLAMTLELSEVDADFLTQALSAMNYRDVVTVYEGYRETDGTLTADPWVAWKGWYEFAQIVQGETNKIAVTCQHDLSVLDEKDGGRYSNEDQQRRYPGDYGFEFVHEMATVKLIWGGERITGGGNLSHRQLGIHDFER